MQTWLVNRIFVAVVLMTAARSVAGDWPQWHGPTRDCRLPEGEPTPSSLSPDLKAVWKIAVGGGFSSPVVAGDKLVYLDEDGKQEIAHLIDARTGKAVWHVPFADRFEDEWGPGPRSTPLIDGDRVYAQSCNGEFRCLSLADGKVIWDFDTVRDYETVNHVLATGGSLNGPGAVVVGGMLFVNSGYARLGSIPGNVLLAFSVVAKSLKKRVAADGTG